MQVKTSPLPGVLIIEPQVFQDDRGTFFESYHGQRYGEAGLNITFVQDNQSTSTQGVLRGLHYQHQHPQGKLVHVVMGEVFDVAVDIRLGSPTFSQWFGLHLSAQQPTQLYIPPGFAHGFCVLSPQAIFVYKCTDFYAPGDEYSIRWNDPQLQIEWPLQQPILSTKDTQAPLLSESTAHLPQFQSLMGSPNPDPFVWPVGVAH